MKKVAHRFGVSFEEICYVGDDLPDLVAIDAAGISAAPSDAAAEVLAAVDWKLDAAGGRGAFREVVERLLKERGDWERIIRDFHGAKIKAPSL
jgi:3-deoxy-D-manno-octulosonate 8-phosphate phosphatase (KDO 8-P phosphatase)